MLPQAHVAVLLLLIRCCYCHDHTLRFFRFSFSFHDTPCHWLIDVFELPYYAMMLSLRCHYGCRRTTRRSYRFFAAALMLRCHMLFAITPYASCYAALLYFSISPPCRWRYCRCQRHFASALLCCCHDTVIIFSFIDISLLCEDMRDAATTLLHMLLDAPCFCRFLLHAAFMLFCHDFAVVIFADTISP